MGDHLRLSFPFATRRFLDPQPRVLELTRTDSDSSDSGVTIQSFRDPTADAQQGNTMVWTNEKHNSYLDFLEASFVKKLHYSKSLHGCHQQMGMWNNVHSHNSHKKDIILLISFQYYEWLWPEDEP
ncbi:cold-regulated protein 28-like isoform X2 [Hibiscus syriacus]|uniref:cold-regulated protein 28-like isoform X2 n=1 Tax=Hibiscus syriacus TaxID=106335 RepID=UPI001924837B|nr:cold-regulated protein 28-like isoform X2 [Hibiscus syriacus]